VTSARRRQNWIGARPGLLWPSARARWTRTTTLLHFPRVVDRSPHGTRGPTAALKDQYLLQFFLAGPNSSRSSNSTQRKRCPILSRCRCTACGWRRADLRPITICSRSRCMAADGYCWPEIIWCFVREWRRGPFPINPYIFSLAGPHTPPDAGTIGRRDPPNARTMQIGGAIVGAVNVRISIVISVGGVPANIRLSKTEPTVSCISRRGNCEASPYDCYRRGTRDS